MFYAVSRLATHTDAQVLHMGALLEFRARLRELVAAGEHHEAALLWGSVLEIQHYPPPPPRLIEGLFPGVPAVRTMPCSEVGCQRRPRGFRFPFVGTYTRSSVVVAAHAWEDFHSHKVPRLAAVDVLNLASGLWPTDLLPAPCGSQSHPRGATPAQLWVVWRQWQQGRQAWREPAYEAVPSWVEGRLNESARAHRALWLLLGALVSGMEVLPAPCLSCGCPSVSRCRRCASAVCRDCIAQCTGARRLEIGGARAWRVRWMHQLASRAHG